MSLIERLSAHSREFGSVSGSPSSSGGGSDAREEGLRRALGAALGSLGELGRMYEERERRWREEMLRLSEERESVEVLLRQTLGSGSGSDFTNHNAIGRAI